MSNSLKKIRKKEEAFFGKDLQFLRNSFLKPNSYKHFKQGINLYQELHFVCIRSKFKKKIFEDFFNEIKDGLEILNLSEKQILETKDYWEITKLWKKLKPYRNNAKRSYSNEKIL